MDRMATKLTISVPDHVADEVRTAVRAGRASSVSGYLVAAVEHYRQSMTLDEWLDQVDAELGPPSAEAYVRVDAQLGLDEPRHPKSA
jgi:Arc/MetJ-type ribon-helix-helix transcriptional regulator